MNLSQLKRITPKVPHLSFPINLDIGCGPANHIKPGYVGIDINDYGQAIIWNVEQGLPLPDNSCNAINASQVFEHVEDFVGIINECHRVLIPGGILSLDVPHKEHTKAYIPSHIRRFDKHTFDFFQYETYTEDYGGSTWEVLSLEVEKDLILYVKMRPRK